MYQYRAIDRLDDTVEFHFSELRDLVAARRFIVRDGSEQDHRRIKRQIRSMLWIQHHRSPSSLRSSLHEHSRGGFHWL
ncbi:hypothetical protein ASC75_24685 [Aminobacter sp. DSM 101952]|nr:hypothetical protein ASC75_24685 [Aminobacter sp. DSM 101952]